METQEKKEREDPTPKSSLKGSDYGLKLLDLSDPHSSTVFKSVCSPQKDFPKTREAHMTS